MKSVFSRAMLISRTLRINGYYKIQISVHISCRNGSFKYLHFANVFSLHFMCSVKGGELINQQKSLSDLKKMLNDFSALILNRWVE